MIGVLDYGIGNLRSAEKALEHLGAEAALLSAPDEADAAEALELPGVGSFGRCAEALRRSGLDAPARRAIEAGRPFLGICVGFQLLYEGSDEEPGVPGLGVLAGRVVRLAAGVKHPQMQWNTITPTGGHCGLLDGIAEPAWVYFVHSFAPEIGKETVATCDYGGPVAAAAADGALWGTQFHPEKSGQVGLAMLANFVAAAAPVRA